jgi:hypothetical protein
VKIIKIKIRISSNGKEELLGGLSNDEIKFISFAVKRVLDIN